MQNFALQAHAARLFLVVLLIPPDFMVEPQESFDPEYMRQLFDRGYRMAAEGYPWQKAPPGFILPRQE